MKEVSAPVPEAQHQVRAVEMNALLLVAVSAMAVEPLQTLCPLPLQWATDITVSSGARAAASLLDYTDYTTCTEKHDLDLDLDGQNRTIQIENR